MTDASTAAKAIQEDREWIANWRGGMYDSGSRDREGWPMEMHGVVASLEERNEFIEVVLARLNEATQHLEAIRDRTEKYRSDTGDPSQQDYRDAVAALALLQGDHA